MRKLWTMVLFKGKQVDYIEYNNLEELNKALKKAYKINIEYKETKL